MKKIIGYYNESNDHFLCTDCFYKTDNLNKKEYGLVEEENLEKDIYTCDECGETPNRKKTPNYYKTKKGEYIKIEGGEIKPVAFSEIKLLRQATICYTYPKTIGN